MPVTFGEISGMSLSVFTEENLDIIPSIAAGSCIVVIGLDIKKHDPYYVICTLKNIRRMSCIECQYIFITFDGFHEDERELHEIPEVIEWAKKFIFEDNSILGILADERLCLDGSMPRPLNVLARAAIGRLKLCGVAGYGKTSDKEKDGSYWMELDETGNALIDSIGVERGEA